MVRLHVKNIVAANSLSNVEQVMRAGESNNIIVFITACGAGLGSGRPEEKPSTPRPLPAERAGG